MQGSKRIIAATLAVFFCAFISTAALATNYYWNADDGDWSVGSNWNPSGPPTSSDYAYIDNDGIARISADAESSDLYLGNTNSGFISQTGGLNRILNHFFLGYSSGSNGTYDLQDGEISTGFDEPTIGYYGEGAFNQNGGMFMANRTLRLGYMCDSVGSYNLYGGELAAFHEEIGVSGIGEFNQFGGTNRSTNHILLGCKVGGSGTYNFEGGEILISACLWVGYEGAGEFNHTSGTNVIGRFGGAGLIVGNMAGINGTYNLNGPGVVTAPYSWLGSFGTGTFNQHAGSVTIEYHIDIGRWVGSKGTYNLYGGDFLCSEEYIGHEGTGEFNQTGGCHKVSTCLYVGYQDASSGEYNFYGGSLEIGDLEINNGWMDIDISEIDYFRVMGDEVDLLDGYIAEGKIFDSSLCPEGYLYAVYDSGNDWTTLQAVPEPGTMAMIAAGALGLAGAIRRKMR